VRVRVRVREREREREREGGRQREEGREWGSESERSWSCRKKLNQGGSEGIWEGERKG